MPAPEVAEPIKRWVQNADGDVATVLNHASESICNSESIFSFPVLGGARLANIGGELVADDRVSHI
jgi:hypothetical protein